MDTEKRPRLKKGEKRIGDTIYTAAEWKSKYCIRAVVIPIVSPVVAPGAGPQSDAVKAAWTELRAILANAWTLSTEAANWALRRLLANEPTRQPGQTKCPPMPPIYLYGERDWTGWSNSASSVLRTVEQTYRAKRYECVWMSSNSLPVVRYPYPYPVKNVTWNLVRDEGGRIAFEARFPTGRIGVWLKAGPQWKRQIAMANHLMDHPELRSEASVYKKNDGSIVVKLVGWFPKREQINAEGMLILRTTKTEFIVGFNTADERLFTIPGDRCKDWIVRTDAMRQRWSDSMKYELRIPKRASRKNMEDMQRQVEKNTNRVHTWIDQTIAACVGHAKRRRLETVSIDDSEREFMPHFPWHRFLTRLEQVCNREGLKFERPSPAKTDATGRKVAKPKEPT